MSAIPKHPALQSKVPRPINLTFETAVTENEALEFVRTSIRSVWALEVLVLLARERERSWPVEEMVHESRSSLAAVNQALILLESTGLVAKTGERAYQYKPVSPTLDAIGELVQKIYSTKPTTVIASIFETPDDKLRAFARAFKFKE